MLFISVNTIVQLEAQVNDLVQLARGWGIKMEIIICYIPKKDPN